MFFERNDVKQNIQIDNTKKMLENHDDHVLWKIFT